MYDSRWVLSRANFLQLDDVWVTKELQDLNFALQLRHHVGLLHFLPVQDLDGDNVAGDLVRRACLFFIRVS